jgi:hypothetical protein
MLAGHAGDGSALNRFLLWRKILFVPLLLCCVPFPADGQITIQGSAPQRKSKMDQHSSEIRLDLYMTPEDAARLLGAVDVVIEFTMPHRVSATLALNPRVLNLAAVYLALGNFCRCP